MNWEAIGAIGEVGGAIGVVATLVYLSIQIRHSAAVTRAQTRAQISLYADRIIETNINNPSVVRIAERARKGQELSEEEQFVRSMQIRRDFRNAEHSYYQYRVGTYDKAEFRGERNTFAKTLTSPEHRVWWSLNRAEFSEIFQKEVDLLIKEADGGDCP